MRQITEIIVHCTATRADWWRGKRTSEKVEEVRRWHTDPKPKGRGWSDIGYHFLIDRDGTVATGRPIERNGAHVLGRNKGTIGVSLFGGHGSSETDKFADNFTPEQNTALRQLIHDLRERYGDVPISGHNEYAAKACPGFQVRKWFSSLPAFIENPAPGPIHTKPKPVIPQEVIDLIEETDGHHSKTTMFNSILQQLSGMGIPVAGVLAWFKEIDPIVIAALIGAGVVIYAITTYTKASRREKASRSEMARNAVLRALGE